MIQSVYVGFRRCRAHMNPETRSASNPQIVGTCDKELLVTG